MDANLKIKDWITKRFIKWISKRYPRYWEITTVYKDGRQSKTHILVESISHNTSYTKPKILSIMEHELTNNKNICMIDAEIWVNVQGLSYRIQDENTKLYRIQK